MGPVKGDKPILNWNQGHAFPYWPSLRLKICLAIAPAFHNVRNILFPIDKLYFFLWSTYIIWYILSFLEDSLESFVCYNSEFIDVPFGNDLFTRPLPDGLSGFAGSKSSVFKCRKGWTTTTINKQRHGFRHLSCYVSLHFLNFYKKYPEIFYSVFVRNEHELQVILSWLWRFPSSVCFCEVRLLNLPIPWNANPVKLCISKMWGKDILWICF